MNNKNLDILKTQIQNLGFSEALGASLEKNMRDGVEEFQLHDERKFGKTLGEARLHFRKAADSDNYYFNKYEARMEKEPEYVRDQEFNVYKGKGLSFEAAYHQLEGRFVYKELTNREGEQYMAWTGLNLDNYQPGKGYERLSYNDNYGFDLQACIDDLKMQPLNTEFNAELLSNLKDGKSQTLLLTDKDGGLKPVTVSANARYKSLDMRRSDGEVIKGLEKKQFLKSTPAEELKSSLQQKKTNDGPSLLAKKKESNGLLPKKKVNQSKGLKM